MTRKQKKIVAAIAVVGVATVYYSLYKYSYKRTMKLHDAEIAKNHLRELARIAYAAAMCQHRIEEQGQYPGMAAFEQDFNFFMSIFDVK